MNEQSALRKILFMIIASAIEEIVDTQSVVKGLNV